MSKHVSAQDFKARNIEVRGKLIVADVEIKGDNEVVSVDSISLAAAGAAGVLVEVLGADWSTTVTDWDVVAGGVACTINSASDGGAGLWEVDIDTPVLPVGAGATVSLVVKGKRASGVNLEYVGSLSLPTV